MKKHLLIWAILLLPSLLFAQTPPELRIKKATVPIVLDGHLTESAWEMANVADKFFLTRPYDTSYASLQTKVMLTFDDENLYVAAEIQQPRANYIISSYKRDFEGGTSDVFSINIDTFSDKLNGFQFSINPMNVQREGLISLGTELSTTWDNKWYSVVKNYDDKWIVEVAIPFKTLRYKVTKEQQNTWRINFGRFSMKTNEVSCWSPVPRNFRPHNLAFAGNLIWEDAPPMPGSNISLIPYLSVGRTADFPRSVEDLKLQGINRNNTHGIGLDAKVAVTPSLNLDLTVNPDFSQVEVDKQQTNLSRFELFFPERRQFFIENSDLFETFGFPPSRPFFSRRIGIAQNTVTGLVQQVPIMGGARLSGKLNEKWRLGAMSMQTRKVEFGNDKLLPATNYSVLSLQRKVFARSAISGIFVNKALAMSGLTIDQQNTYERYNRVGGLEFNYFSPDGKLETETYIHQSFSPKTSGDASSAAHYMGYHHPNVDINIGLMRIGKDYRAETGYVPRVGVYNFYRNGKLIFYPNKKHIAKFINLYGIGVEGEDTYSLTGKRLDSELPIFVFLSAPNGAELAMGYFIGFTHLFEPFEATNAAANPNPDLWRGLVPLPVGDYRYQAPFINYKSSQRYNLRGMIDIWHGDYFNGKGTGVSASLAYRLQPYGNFTVDVEYNDLNLPKPYNKTAYWLIGPRAELAFTKSLFFSTFFQYNTQTNNTNINSRLQWRFKPVSDLFIVYTNNYFSQEIPNYGIKTWTPKNQALILKATYWLNL